jgi:hypothetical protein
MMILTGWINGKEEQMDTQKMVIGIVLLLSLFLFIPWAKDYALKNWGLSAN